MTTRKKAEWLVIVFFLVIIGIVFQQIATDMTESGIASGGPYDNAAAYPKYVAITMGLLLAFLLAQRFVMPGNHNSASGAEGAKASRDDIRRGILLFVIFAAYLWALGILGYYISTPFMILGVMYLSGLRRRVELVAASVGISFILAFLFEFFLKIVLPGGMFGLNIAW